MNLKPGQQIFKSEILHQAIPAPLVDHEQFTGDPLHCLQPLLSHLSQINAIPTDF